MTRVSRNVVWGPGVVVAAALVLSADAGLAAQGRAVLRVSAEVRPSCVVRVDQPSESDELPRLSLRCGREALAIVRMTTGSESMSAPWRPDEDPEGTWLIPIAAHPVASADLQSLPADARPAREVVVTLDF